MDRKKSPVNRILVILLVLSLCANGVLAVLLAMASSRADQRTEQLQRQTEKEALLHQEESETSGTENKTDGTQEESQSEILSELQTENQTGDQTEEETEGISEAETSGTGASQVSDQGPIPEIVEKEISAREKLGEVWSVSVQTLGENPQIYQYNGDERMQSASVIKVFIMGAVYDRMCYPSSPDRLISMEESYEGELRDLIEQMITVSDNNAANRLVELLGQGDFQAGAQVVNQFCRENGFDSTSLGRRFLEENPSDDNYTSADDCRAILSMIYDGTCVGTEASEKMLEILRQQTNTVKIPSGLPDEVQTANKTGEMPEGYGLGCIENDMAIIFSQEGDLILVVLSNNLGGRNDEAQQVIRNISADVWAWFA